LSYYNLASKNNIYPEWRLEHWLNEPPSNPQEVTTLGRC